MTFADRPRFKNGKVQTFWPDWRLYQYAAWSKTKWENIFFIFHKNSHKHYLLIQNPKKESSASQSIFVLVFTFDLYLYLSFATEGQEPRKEEGDWVPVVSIGNRFLRLRKPPYPLPTFLLPSLTNPMIRYFLYSSKLQWYILKKTKKNVTLLAPDSLVHHV